MSTQRVTITLPVEVVAEIDRRERNRSRFVLHALQREIERRRREDLHRSLGDLHPESEALAELGLSGWANEREEEDERLLDEPSGRRVRWRPGEGWTEVS